MSKYLVTLPARDDLAGIWDYIAEQSSFDRADYVLEKLFDVMARIADSPGLGHPRTDIVDETLRVYRVFSYLVIYRQDSSPIQIVRVIHGARDIQAIFGEPE
jgi:plasmid stabilization system protein ParE